MRKAGYRDQKQQPKSLTNLFADAEELAEQSNEIQPTAKGWQNTFTRIKQEYSAFFSKIKHFKRDGNDEDLFNTPEFFEQMRELENCEPKYDSPAHY